MVVGFNAGTSAEGYGGPTVSDSTNLTPTTEPRRDWGERALTFVRSNSSVVGAFLVLGGLFLAQRYVGAWLTDAAVIDESDIPPASAAVPVLDADEATNCDPWLLTFADEFDGDGVDDDQWIRFDSPDRNGNGVRRPEAITVEDGVLVITARQVGDEVVTGAMASRHQQLHGRIEARVRTGIDPSEMTSGRILTWPAGNEHPEGGENDLYDTLTSADREPIYSYIHHPDSTREEVVHNVSGEEWHNLAMEWTADAVTILRDDETVETITEADAIADTPHVLSIQLVADGAELNENVVRMEVDWIRAYQANESPANDC